MAQGAYDGVNMHRVRVGDIKHLNAVILRNLGAEILDAFEVGDMAVLTQQSLAKTHEISRIKSNPTIVDHPWMTVYSTPAGP